MENETVLVQEKAPKATKGGWQALDFITNTAITAIISLMVVFGYNKFIGQDNRLYVVDYVEIINLKKEELVEAFKSGDQTKAENASKELETIITQSAKIVQGVSQASGKPVINKQLLVTFEGTVDITSQVKQELIKQGLIKNVKH